MTSTRPFRSRFLKINYRPGFLLMEYLIGLSIATIILSSIMPLMVTFFSMSENIIMTQISLYERRFIFSILESDAALAFNIQETGENKLLIETSTSDIISYSLSTGRLGRKYLSIRREFLNNFDYIEGFYTEFLANELTVTLFFKNGDNEIFTFYCPQPQGDS
jgi:hypothetical protein